MEKTKPQLLARAIAIAAEAHQRQLDKAGSPYILHPLRMMMRAQSLDLLARRHSEGPGDPLTSLESLLARYSAQHVPGLPRWNDG